MYNADVLLGALGATLGRMQSARAGPADVDGLPAAQPLPHRRDAGDVHARRLHARRRRDDDRRRSCTPSTTSTPSAAASTCARRRRRQRRSSTCAPRSRSAPGLRPADFRLVSSESTLPVQGAPARNDRARRSPTSSTASTRRFLAHTTYRLARPRARLRLGRRGLARAPRRTRTSPSSTSSSSRGRRTGARRPADVPALTGFYLEDKTFAPGAGRRSATRRPASSIDADRDRRALRQRAAS